MNTPQWLNEKEVSRITGRAEQTLRNDRFIQRGIPYSKIGRSVRYRLDDVVDHMEKNRVIPGNREA
ncbi:MAG: helix-turn-helix domain-containing protein [Proteobacteria bacterium]|nr:helix-turn-helix domain-containing protein [Pseudomonadota bacterium]